MLRAVRPRGSIALILGLWLAACGGATGRRGLVEDPWRRFECAPDSPGCVVSFEDPEFSRSGATFSYARALQEPTPAVNGANLRTERDATGPGAHLTLLTVIAAPISMPTAWRPCRSGHGRRRLRAISRVCTRSPFVE